VYCQEIRSSDLTLTLEQYVRRVMTSAPVWFETLQLIEDTLGPDSVHFVRFERSQRFFEEMLNALGLTTERYLGPRVPPVVNQTFSLKGQVALVHHRKLSQEFGFDVHRYHLWAAVQHKLLGFSEDRERYPLLGHDLASEVHQAALQAAAQRKFDPYLEFFATDPPPERGDPVSFDFRILTDEDKAGIRSTLCELVRIHGLGDAPKDDGHTRLGSHGRS
jgi:hypothetical protein